MAVVVNSDANVFVRSANVPANTSYSQWGWFLFTNLPGGWWGMMAVMDGTAGSPTNYSQIGTNNNNRPVLWFKDTGGADVALAMPIFASADPALNTWYFVAWTRSGNATGNLIAYARSITQQAFTSVANDRAMSSWNPTRIEWGREGITGDYMRGAMHGLGAADTVLSADELLAISYYHEPQRAGIRSLNVFYPTIESVNTNASIDRSGNARNATATVGALAASPPLLWQLRKRMSMVSVGGVTPVTGIVRQMMQYHG